MWTCVLVQISLALRNITLTVQAIDKKRLLFLLVLLDCCLKLNILYNYFVPFNFLDEMCVLLQFFRKLNCKYKVTYPLLSYMLELTCIDFFIRLFNDKVMELFFHEPSFLPISHHPDAFQNIERRYLFCLPRIITLIFVSDHWTLKRIYKKIPLFQIHEGSFGFENKSSKRCG